MSTTHARRGRIATFAALFRHDDARPPHPRVSVGVPGFEAFEYLPGPSFGREEPHGIATRETLDRIRTAAEAMTQQPPQAPPPADTGPWWMDYQDAPEVPASPVHMVSDETVIMPCCGLTEFQVPLTDCVTMNPRLVTCRRAAHDTMPDQRAAMPRPYAPEPYTPDLCADLADLPLFREALSQRTRCRAGECLCGHPVTGDTWGERMVRAGIHLLTGNEAAA